MVGDAMTPISPITPLTDDTDQLITQSVSLNTSICHGQSGHQLGYGIAWDYIRFANWHYTKLTQKSFNVPNLQFTKPSPKHHYFQELTFYPSKNNKTLQCTTFILQNWQITKLLKLGQLILENCPESVQILHFTKLHF